MGIWNVVLLGLISFFADVSTEMAYPLIPLFLTTAFGATPALIGLIEGIAESVASLLRVFSGYLSDRFRRKKPLAFAGYAAGLAYKILLLAAGSWAGVLLARVVDRMGKGIRTAPRDVLISESSAEGRLGGSYGLHKALDMAGSALGILLAFFIVQSGSGPDYTRRIFLLSIFPALVGLALFLPLKERRRQVPAGRREPLFAHLGALDVQLKAYLAVTVLFTLGNSSNAFLLLRAKSLGYGDTGVILLYFLYNLSASLLSFPLGKVSDRIGRKTLLVAGYLIFALVYGGFGLAGSGEFLIPLFLLYGLFTALTAGVERAFIADIAPPELKGTMLGLQGTLAGLALFPASLIAGLLWNGFGAAAPFLFGGGLAACSALVLQFFLQPKRTARPGKELPQ